MVSGKALDALQKTEMRAVNMAADFIRRERDSDLTPEQFAHALLARLAMNSLICFMHEEDESPAPIQTSEGLR